MFWHWEATYVNPQRRPAPPSHLWSLRLEHVDALIVRTGNHILFVDWQLASHLPGLSAISPTDWKRGHQRSDVGAVAYRHSPNLRRIQVSHSSALPSAYVALLVLAGVSLRAVGLQPCLYRCSRTVEVP
jgi:hypothetical protein